MRAKPYYTGSASRRMCEIRLQRLASACFSMPLIFADHADIGKILRELCSHKGVEIQEAYMCADHVHMLVSIPPKMSVSSFMEYLKGKSTLMIFERHANLKYKYGNRVFWCKGYFVSTVGRNKQAIAAYIKNQEKEDMMRDQMTLKEYVDPFKGSK